MICTTCSCNPENIPGELLIDCKSCRLICVDSACCLSATAEKHPIGVIKEDGMIFKVGLPCCAMGIMKPDMKNLIAGTGSLLCATCSAALPFGGPVPKPICAVCFIQCSQDGVGVAQPPYLGKTAIQPVTMNR
jgi:hypothetical protein